MRTRLVAGFALLTLLTTSPVAAWPGPGAPEILSPMTRPEALSTLRFFLTQVPAGLYPHLRFITVGDFPLLQERARDCRVIEGYGTYGPTFTMTLDIDPQCRVRSVVGREGL